MKNFFKTHSYNSVKLFLNQIVMSMLGLMMLLVATKLSSFAFRLLAGLFSIGFYLFLTYTSMWEVGNRDKLDENGVADGKRMFSGFFIALVSNSLNILLAVFVALGKLFSSSEFFGSIGGVSAVIANLIEGVYAPITGIEVSVGKDLKAFAVTYFIMVLPSLITATLAYIAGRKDLRITKPAPVKYPASDRPTKKEMKERMKDENK